MTQDKHESTTDASDKATMVVHDSDLIGLAMLGASAHADRPQRPLRPSFVYFCQRTDGAIKIGTSFDPCARSKALRTQSGHEVVLLACFPGGRAEEQALHQQFASARIVGEWFTQSPELSGVIALRLREHGEPAALVSETSRRHKIAMQDYEAASEQYRAKHPAVPRIRAAMAEIRDQLQHQEAASLPTQRKVMRFSFYEDTLDVMRLPDGDVGVSLRRMCEALGLDFSAQRKRLERIANSGKCRMHTTGSDGKAREMTFLPRRSIPMWLATVDAGRVRAEVRPKIVRYQNEAADALDAYFNKGVAVNPAFSTADVLAALGPIGEHVAALVKRPAVDSDALANAVARRLPATVEGLATALRPYLHQEIADATAPLAVRVGETMQAVHAIGADVRAMRDADVLNHMREAMTMLANGMAVRLSTMQEETRRALGTTHDLLLHTDKVATDLASRDGCISGTQADWLKGDIRTLAQKRLAAGLSKKPTIRSARTGVCDELLVYVAWKGKGHTLTNLPAGKFPDAKAWLRAQHAIAEERLRSAPPPRDPSGLFGAN